ncbi:hypothetical protein J6590_063955 [Homalodisca vitripennis]|nr:hypothetical protein J6590_063955 [Homalodisca vitripennis]
MDESILHRLEMKISETVIIAKMKNPEDEERNYSTKRKNPEDERRNYGKKEEPRGRGEANQTIH